jgi:short-subunit dehydrogenase
VLSKALADTPIKVTSVCRGWVQTDLAPGNKEQAPATPEEASKVVVQAATLSVASSSSDSAFSSRLRSHCWSSAWAR